MNINYYWKKYIMKKQNMGFLYGIIELFANEKRVV